MRRPRLRCIETGRWTRITRHPTLGLWEFEEAMHRIVQRDFPGHYAAPLEYADELGAFEACDDCRTAELVRPVGERSERTGRVLHFELKR